LKFEFCDFLDFFLKFSKRRHTVPLRPIWIIMVAAKLDHSRVLVTKFRQNRSTLNGGPEFWNSNSVIFENFLKFSKRRHTVPLRPIWIIMVAAKIDHKFRQNRLALKGRSAGLRHTHRQTAENKGPSGLQSGQQVTKLQQKSTKCSNKTINIGSHKVKGTLKSCVAQLYSQATYNYGYVMHNDWVQWIIIWQQMRQTSKYFCIVVTVITLQVSISGKGGYGDSSLNIPTAKSPSI